MEDTTLRYVTGEEVHAGDRVQYRGTFATVVFVTDGDTEEFSPGYEDFAGAERGVVLCDDGGSPNSIGEPDEMLTFLDRG